MIFRKIQASDWRPRWFFGGLLVACFCASVLITACGGPGEVETAGVAKVVESRTPVEGGAMISHPDLSQVQPATRASLESRQSDLQAGIDQGRPTGRQFGELGRYYLAASFSNAAAACFRNALVLEPDHFEWNYLLAHIRRGEGEYEEAVRLFGKAAVQEPDALAVMVWLGRSLLETGANDEAGQQFDKALEIYPESSSALAGMGDVALANGRYQEAVEYLAKALELVPGADGMHYPLAMAYRGLGDMTRAEEHLQLRGEIEIYPEDPWMEPLKALLASPMMFSERGGRSYATGNFEQAIDEFRKGLEMAPDDPLMHLNLGSALYEAGRKEEAEAEIQAALALDAGYAEALYSQGAIRENEGNDFAAERLYKEALGMRADLSEAKQRLAGVFARAGRMEDAVEQYAGTIVLDPRQAPARFGLAMTLVRAGKIGGAVAALEDARSAFPDQPVFTHALARLLAGSPDPAWQDGQRALSLLDTIRTDDVGSDMGESIAMALARSGHFEPAVRWQEMAVAAATGAGQERLAQAMSRPLKAYKAGRPWDSPWRENDPIFLIPRDAHPYQPRRARE